MFHRHLKGWETIGTLTDHAPGEREEFSLPVFYEKLAKWIAVDDQASVLVHIFIAKTYGYFQSLDVVDCPELRDLLLFIGTELDDKDIPHRTKLSEIITTQFKAEYAKMVLEIQVCYLAFGFLRCSYSDNLQNALSRVSFTDDIWTRQNLNSHLAITAHYIVKDANGHLVLKTRLVAFRRMEGSHTGQNIGQLFVQVLKEIGCLHKVSRELTYSRVLTKHPFVQVGMITCDNASNNNTGMAEICDELSRIGIPFNVDGNRIR